MISFSVRKTRQQARHDVGGAGGEGGGTSDGGGGANSVAGRGGSPASVVGDHGGGRDSGAAGTERRTRRANVDVAAATARGQEGGANGRGRGGDARAAGRVTRQRAKAKADNAAKANQNVVEEEILDDDDEPDVGKTLHAKDGKLGFVSNRGFVAATNFLVDIQAQVFSETYSIKGMTYTY